MTKQTQKTRLSYKNVLRISKIGAPIMRALLYISLVCAAILIIMAPIIFLVDISPQEMILPPYMKAVLEDGKLASYDIFIGNGIRINAQAAKITLKDIKTVIYTGIFYSTAILLVIAPIFKFLSSLLENVSKGRVLVRKNADLICYIGFTVIVGNTLVLFLRRFYNYLLVSTFLSEGESVRLALNLDLYGIIVGAFILLVGLIFGYAASLAEKNADEIPLELPADIE